MFKNIKQFNNAFFWHVCNNLLALNVNNNDDDGDYTHMMTLMTMLISNSFVIIPFVKH